jgi:hypothetical protein
MDQEQLDAIVAQMTPEGLETIIRAIARTQAADNQRGVAIAPIIEALADGADLGTGSAGWEAYLRLKQAVMDTVAHIVGIKYVEADS